MLDARYFAFATLSALLVISPGATLAVVVETALGEGRRAALLTVLGVGLANATLATAAAVGLSAVFAQWPSALHGFRLAGGTYLAYLGLRGLRHALARGRRRAKGETRAGGGRETGGAAAAAATVPRERTRVLAHVVRGILTNLLNPPVVLFYMTVVPQFIGPQDPFLARALLLGTTHVAMSVVWQGSCGLAVGFAAEHMARPAVRRTLEGLTGVALVALGARLLL
jgi:threonine/homoserine/homoserine lactone efflux protein